MKVQKKTPVTKSALIVMLLPIVLIVSGGYFCIDLPQSMASPMIAYFDITPKDISNLYVAYSIPNFVLGPMSGFFIQEFGPANSAIILSMMCFVGMLGMYVGLETRSFIHVLIGRAIFGAGAENLLIAVMAAIGKWYFGKFLSLASGITLSVNMTMGALGNFLTPLIFIYFRNLKIAMFVATVTCFASFLAAAAYSFIDVFFSDIYLTVESQDNEENEITERVQITWKSPLRLGKLYWWTNSIYSILPNGYFMLSAMLTDLAQVRFGYTYLKASTFVPEVQILTVIAMPIISGVVQKTGKKGIIMFVSSLILVGAHVLLAFQPKHPTWLTEAAFPIYGTYLSLYQSCIWPSLNLSIPSDAVGLAYGIATITQMIFYGGLPLLFGEVASPRTPAAYQNCIWLLIGLSVIGSLLSFITMLVDFKEGGLLHHPENSDKVRFLKQKINQVYRKKTILEIERRESKKVIQEDK